jgi:hypothetical protein
MDSDRPGVAERTLEAIRSWPPGLPVFGQLTPYPATPLYDKLAAAGRLSRPKHWLDFKPFVMAYQPQTITIDQVSAELAHAWGSSYSAVANASALKQLGTKPLGHRLMHFFARLLFRGIYFPQMKRREWVRLLVENRGPVLRLFFQALEAKLGSRHQNSSAPSVRSLDHDAAGSTERVQEAAMDVAEYS